jgi:predicted Fe-S protein YdhL (DUF1289 family)
VRHACTCTSHSLCVLHCLHAGQRAFPQGEFRTKEERAARAKAAQQERQRDVANQRMVQSRHSYQPDEGAKACLRDLRQAGGRRGVADAPAHLQHIGRDSTPGSRAERRQGAPLDLGFNIWMILSSRGLESLHIQLCTGCGAVRCYLGGKARHLFA